jgi:hypothetical protein
LPPQIFIWSIVQHPKNFLKVRGSGCLEKDWEFSSAGSEHLPYKQRVTGSNPVTPT